MFTQRADGPHPSEIPTIAGPPTIEEIIIGQAAVLEAIGEKNSEKRSHANSLCADGLIDQEQGLGYFLTDRFSGALPSVIESRQIGKNAALKVPNKKTKDKWREKGKAARDKAKKAGLDEDAVVAAGKAARQNAEAECVESEVHVVGLVPPLTSPSPEPPELPTKPSSPHVCSEACDGVSEQMCPRGREILDMAMSREAAATIITAYTIMVINRQMNACDPYSVEFTQQRDKPDLAEIRFKHALRKLREAYPRGDHCKWSHEQSSSQVVDWTIGLEAAGYPIPAAAAVAARVGFNLKGAAARWAACKEADACHGRGKSGGALV